MGVVWSRQGKRRVATRTPLGVQFLDGRGRDKRLTMARMARFPARFLGRGGPLAGVLVWRGWWRGAGGRRGILCGGGLPGVPPLAEVGQGGVPGVLIG